MGIIYKNKNFKDLYYGSKVIERAFKGDKLYYQKGLGPVPPQAPVTSKSFRFENKSAQPIVVWYGSDWNGEGNDTYLKTKFIISKDGVEWFWWVPIKVKGEWSVEFDKITVEANETLYVRGIGNERLGGPSGKWNYFVIQDECECHGNLSDLCPPGVYSYGSIFMNCAITTLPDDVRFTGAYDYEWTGTFFNTHIRQLPKNFSGGYMKLGGDVMGEHACWATFMNCKYLQAPKIWAQAYNLWGNGACGNMFQNCKSNIIIKIATPGWTPEITSNQCEGWIDGTLGGNIDYMSGTINSYGGWDKLPDNWTFNGQSKPA